MIDSYFGICLNTEHEPRLPRPRRSDAPPDSGAPAPAPHECGRDRRALPPEQAHAVRPFRDPARGRSRHVAEDRHHRHLPPQHLGAGRRPAGFRRHLRHRPTQSPPRQACKRHDMIARIHATAAAVLVLCMFAVAALVIAHHPAARPLVGLPIIAALVWIFFAGAPWITPRGRNLLRAHSAYGTIWLAMTSLLAIVFGVMVARLLHAHPAHGIIFVGFGIVLIVIGNLCAKLPPNRLAGVRTPWA